MELKDNYYITSLKNAREGTQNGRYATYIIIPADFSNNIESINTKPNKSTIMYSLNDNLRRY